MEIVVFAVCATVIIGAAVEIWGRIAYRRWRRRFDAMPPDKQRKAQERLYKAKI